jgi:hypothetical protein
MQVPLPLRLLLYRLGCRETCKRVAGSPHTLTDWGVSDCPLCAQSRGIGGGRRTAVSDWYQPREQWPRHPSPWWRETLDHARAAGWRLKTIEGHSWGRIVCDPDAENPCKILLFSTGKGAESVARDARKTIDRCGHLASAVDGQGLARAAALLDQAERLIEAARCCLQAAGKEVEAQELLAGAASATTAAEALLDQAMKAESEGNELLVQAFDVLPSGSQMGCPPTAQEVEALVVEAGARAEEARQAVDGFPQWQPVDQLRDRIVQVTTRKDELLRMLRSGNADGEVSA